MSAFALLIPPTFFSKHLRRLTERSATLVIIAIITKSQFRQMALAPLHLRRGKT